MKNDYTSPDFKKLLDKLQQESWQLELIISGFAIYGLIISYEPLVVENLKAVKNDEILGANFYGITLTSISILIILLLTHVVMRGIWIGAIGLRYVSGDIDYESLNYSEKFKVFLQKKVGSFDRYISKLENISSTIFALAFLMIFFFISFFMVFGFFAISANYIDKIEPISDIVHNVVKYTFSIIYFFCVLLLLIDFLGAGLLKKYKWTSKIYFPIYRVFGFITLAFLYRPLVYNFLDQKKARWLAVFIVPFYLIFSLFISGFGKLSSNYLVVDQSTSGIYTNKENYEDLLIEDTDLMRLVSIPSKVIEKPYLPIFIEFNKWMEDFVFQNDSTLLPEKDKRGYGFYTEKFSSAMNVVSITINSSKTMDYQKRYLKSLDAIFELHIDSTRYTCSYGMTANQKDRFGFETYLDIGNLPKGKHLLQFIGPNENSEGIFQKDTLITIPFWYFPQNTPTISNSSKIEIDSTSSK